MAGPDDDRTYLANNHELEENRIDHPQPRNFGEEIKSSVFGDAALADKANRAYRNGWALHALSASGTRTEPCQPVAHSIRGLTPPARLGRMVP